MNLNSESTAQANFVWGDVVARTLHELGVSMVFFSPGSRSTPLVLALERHPFINCASVLDERTAAFLALGYSRRTQEPAVILCTSGSAVTNWFPAIAEASHSSVPLLFLSADRPEELQNCASGQTIDQVNLFGSFVRGFHQIPLPDLDPTAIQSLRNALTQAYFESMDLNPGPVHLNFPFREPFLPLKLPDPVELSPLITMDPSKLDSVRSVDEISRLANQFVKPLIISGEHASAAFILDWLSKYPTPVLCDSLSPLREYPLSTKILRYENLLRDSSFAQQAKPDLIIVLGPLPTSKTLRSWIDQSGAERLVIEPRGISVDPLTSTSHSFQLEYSRLSLIELPVCGNEWVKLWRNAEKSVEKKLELAFSEQSDFFEGKLVRLLSKNLPDHSCLQVSNSMPIRDLEWFWYSKEKKRKIFGNRGVNGIDGTLGTALGLAHLSDSPAFLLTGELAFLHDSNALLFHAQFMGSLTVFIINNKGGGIFENLPVAEEPEFEKCFATPQECDFSLLCGAHGIEFICPSTWEEISGLIQHPIATGIRVIEMKCDRKKDRETRRRLLSLSAS
jgi:2-succinyl-5-enolpyruvyl-6-hydroxy-3-cyclohexene-1-carboxylate synthase